MKIGIIGTGRMGTQRAEHVLRHPEAECLWLCSRDRRRAQKVLDGLAADYPEAGEADAVEDWRAAVKRRDTDAVIITTPNSLHLRQVREAFEAGKHIMVEFPHAVSVDDGKEMLLMAEKGQCAFHVGLTHLYSNRHKALRDLCRAGRSEGPGTFSDDLGRPLVFHEIICSGNPISRWFDDDALSGGMFIASLYHFIDEALDLFGEAGAVHASYQSSRKPDGRIIQDTALCHIDFADGCTGQIGYARGFPKPGLGTQKRIIFEKGYVVLKDGSYVVLTEDGEKPLQAVDNDAAYDDTAAFIGQIQEGRNDDGTTLHAQNTLETAYRAQRRAGL